MRDDSFHSLMPGFMRVNVSDISLWCKGIELRFMVQFKL